MGDVPATVTTGILPASLTAVSPAALAVVVMVLVLAWLSVARRRREADVLRILEGLSGQRQAGRRSTGALPFEVARILRFGNGRSSERGAAIRERSAVKPHNTFGRDPVGVLS